MTASKSDFLTERQDAAVKEANLKKTPTEDYQVTRDLGSTKLEYDYTPNITLYLKLNSIQLRCLYSKPSGIDGTPRVSSRLESTLSFIRYFEEQDESRWATSEGFSLVNLG